MTLISHTLHHFLNKSYYKTVTDLRFPKFRLILYRALRFKSTVVVMAENYTRKVCPNKINRKEFKKWIYYPGYGGIHQYEIRHVSHFYSSLKNELPQEVHLLIQKEKIVLSAFYKIKMIIFKRRLTFCVKN